MPDRDRVRRAFEVRPRARQGAYAPRWDRWLLPRVSGQYVGTTDEILQWAACKWGIADNVLRAVAERESGWYQHQVYPDGSCVVGSGCGDMFPQGSRAARDYCRTVAGHSPRDGRGALWRDCPRTFSIVGVMSWHDPRWGRLPGNQNGTYPFNVRSTAFAVDYLGSFLRGCLEGWVRWLANTGRYRAGDLGGCLGAWFAGAWKSPDAREYASRVLETLTDRVWLQSAWFRRALPCEPDRGCPAGGALTVDRERVGTPLQVRRRLLLPRQAVLDHPPPCLPQRGRRDGSRNRSRTVVASASTSPGGTKQAAPSASARLSFRSKQTRGRAKARYSRAFTGVTSTWSEVSTPTSAEAR